MKEKILNEIALLRYGIIMPLVTGTYDNEKSKSEFFRNAASKCYENSRGEDIKVSMHTIKRWYTIYQKEGFDGLKPKRRADYSQHRKVDDEIIQQVRYYKKEYPRIPATLIYQKLLDNGTLMPGDLSLSTVNRIVNQIKKQDGMTNRKDMKRYERKHINEVWCGDSSVGPYIKLDGKKYKTYIIALIDDASRYIVGIDIYLNDNYVNLMSVIKSAVSRYGKPKIFNFDNGANYKCNQMKLLGARIGAVINYCAPYTPTSKAKIERWFRTMKDHWMSTLVMSDFKTLDELRSSLMKYVQSYNQSTHQSLDGATPQERFFEESNKIYRLDEEMIEKAFLLEVERKVSADNVIVIDQEEYEVHYRYAGQKLLLRYSPDLSKIYVIDKDSREFEEIQLLNKQANAHVKRKKVKMIGEEE